MAYRDQVAPALQVVGKSNNKPAPRKDRAKAREIAKGAKGKGESGDRELRQSKEKLEELLEHAQYSDNKYVLGVRDALLFALGRIGHGSFQSAFRTHMAKAGFDSDKKGQRAADNRNGVHGRGPQDHQRKVDKKKPAKAKAKPKADGKSKRTSKVVADALAQARAKTTTKRARSK